MIQDLPRIFRDDDGELLTPTPAPEPPVKTVGVDELLAMGKGIDATYKQMKYENELRQLKLKQKMLEAQIQKEATKAPVHADNPSSLSEKYSKIMGDIAMEITEPVLFPSFVMNAYHELLANPYAPTTPDAYWLKNLFDGKSTIYYKTMIISEAIKDGFLATSSAPGGWEGWQGSGGPWAKSEVLNDTPIPDEGYAQDVIDLYDNLYGYPYIPLP